eukprot:2803373-Heterocapsa_arctica.AAC.1
MIERQTPCPPECSCQISAAIRTPVIDLDSPSPPLSPRAADCPDSLDSPIPAGTSDAESTLSYSDQAEISPGGQPDISDPTVGDGPASR